MKRIRWTHLCLLTGLLSWAAPLQAQDVEIDGSIRHTSQVITIDGIPDEAAWGAANEYDNFFTAANSDPDDAEDLSCKWRALWDDDNIYFYVEVTDDANVIGDNNDWQDDSIELYIDADGLGKDEGPTVQDYNAVRDFPVFQLTILSGEIELHNGINHEAWIVANDDVADLNAVANVDPDTADYSFEMAFPWKTLGDSTPAEIIQRGFFGLGLAVNDDDDEEGRDSQLMWATDSGELWHDATVFPNVELLFPEGPGPDIFVKGNLDLGQISSEQQTHDFVLEVRNVGQENPLTLSNIAVTGPDKDLVTLGSLATVGPNAVGELPFTLNTGGRTGAFDFTIEITSDDADEEDKLRSTRVSASVINFSGPAIHYAMDDAVGGTELRDITGYNRHGLLDGGASLGGAGLAGGTSLNVSGGSQGVIPGGLLGAMESFSLSMWIQPSELGAAQTVISQGIGSPTFAVLVQDGDLNWFAGGAPEFGAAGAIAAGTSYHVVITYSASQAVLYLDGVAVATQDDPTEVGILAEDGYFIGAFDGGLPFAGLIDDVQIYDRVLSADDAAFLFGNPGLAIQPDGVNRPTPNAGAVVLAADGAGGYVAGGAADGGAPGLAGSYWLLGPKDVPTADLPMHRAGADGANAGWVDENVYGTEKTGTFTATTFNYGGNDVTPIKEWLMGDADSFAGTEANLDDGVFRFEGFLYAAAPGNQEITFTSDDGSVLYVGNQLVINNDNGHGNQDVTGEVFFPEAGFYPIDIRYFNGDWTNAAGDHGGANFIAVGLDNVVQTAGAGGAGAEPDADAVVLAADGAGGFVADGASAGAAGLRGSYWLLEPKGVPTADLPMHRAGADGANAGWVDANVYGAETTGTFTATTFNYGGNDVTPIKEWLMGDADSFAGTEANLDDGVFRFEGFLYAAEAGNQEITFTSDDGSVLYVGNQLVINNDNGHGNQDVTGKVFFPEAGYYPVDIRYFNGDWTNDAGDHGGANFIAAGLDNVVQWAGSPPRPPVTGAVLYANEFTYPNDTIDLGDGSIIASNDGTHSVQEGVLRMTAAGINGTAASFVLPPFDASAGWTATFDFVVEHSGENTPADGFSVNYGLIPEGENFGNPAEEGYGDATPHVSYQVDTWLWNDAEGQDAGVGVELTGVELGLTKATDDNANFQPNERVAGSAILSWDPVDGASFATTGLRTNADFANLPTAGFTPDASYGFSILARTGGHNETVEIDNLEIRSNADDDGQPAPIEGLLGYWRLDGNASDASGGGRDGNVVNPDGVWKDDAERGAVYQSGNGSFIELGNLPIIGLDSDFTWSFWVNADETDNNNIVFGNRYSPDGTDFAPREFIKFTPRVFEWHFNGGGENVPGDNTMFVVGQWTHNLVVKSGDTLIYYRDGTEVASGTVTGAPANGQPLYLGGQNGLENFSGLFDEVAVFDRALSPADVSEVYNRGVAGQGLGGGGEQGGPGLPALTAVGFTAGGFSLTVPAGETVDVEYSTDLVDWQTIASDVAGAFEDTDANRNAGSAGYYRARRD